MRDQRSGDCALQQCASSSPSSYSSSSSNSTVFSFSFFLAVRPKQLISFKQATHKNESKNYRHVYTVFCCCVSSIECRSCSSDASPRTIVPPLLLIKSNNKERWDQDQDEEDDVTENLRGGYWPPTVVICSHVVSFDILRLSASLNRANETVRNAALMRRTNNLVQIDGLFQRISCTIIQMTRRQFVV